MNKHISLEFEILTCLSLVIRPCSNVSHWGVSIFAIQNTHRWAPSGFLFFLSISALLTAIFPSSLLSRPAKNLYMSLQIIASWHKTAFESCSLEQPQPFMNLQLFLSVCHLSMPHSKRCIPRVLSQASNKIYLYFYCFLTLWKSCHVLCLCSSFWFM